MGVRTDIECGSMQQHLAKVKGCEIGFKFEIPMVKLLRAHGGCLGIERRRKAWKSAKSLGEPTNR